MITLSYLYDFYCLSLVTPFFHSQLFAPAYWQQIQIFMLHAVTHCCGVLLAVTKSEIIIIIYSYNTVVHFSNMMLR